MQRSTLLNGFGKINEVSRRLNFSLSNPNWTLMRLLGRFDLIRSLSEMRSRPVEIDVDLETSSVFPEINVEEAVESLNRDGLYLGLRLPQEVLTEIVSFALSAPCYGEQNPEHEFYYNGKNEVKKKDPHFYRTAQYFKTISQCPAIRKLASDPKLLAIAARYLKAEPVLQGTILWWSFAGDATSEERSKAAQMFHFDLDDYRFIKFFFYLTDVDSAHGPHVCVRGTHNKKRLRHQIYLRRYQDEQIVRDYGADNVVTICGKAGTGFAEDTRCFHRGTAPASGDRLLFQLEFACHDYGLQHDHKDGKGTLVEASLSQDQAVK